MDSLWCRNMLVKAACIVMSLGAVFGLVVAQDAALSKRVDLYLKDAELLAATQALSRQTGLQFVIATSNAPFNKINLSLNGATAEEAIRYLCQAANAYAERDENGVYIIRQGKPDAKANVEPTPILAPQSVVRKIHLMKADPKYVYDMIRGELLDPFEAYSDITKLNQVIRPDRPGLYAPNVNVVGAQQYPPQISYPYSNVQGNRVNQVHSESGSSVTLPGEPFAGQIAPGGGGAGQPGGGGGFGQPGGGGGQPGGGQGGPQLQGGQGLVPQGIESVQYDPTDNSLVVRGSDEAIRRLRSLIGLFDVAPKQVEVKLEYITTSSSNAKSLGIDWLYQRGTVFAGNRPGTFARVDDPIFINYATGNITARLRTLLSEGYGKSVQSPIIRTLNNQFAIIQATIETTIFVQQSVNGPGGIQTFFNPVRLPITTGLAVRPRVNGDGTITMTLQPTISELGQRRADRNGNEFPDILSQSISVVARVKNGETIVLGGLVRKTENNTQSRFPILSDLPIIGQFFRTNSSEKNQSELLIFVTPRVIEDEDASSGP